MSTDGARLIALCGPLKGTAFIIENQQLTIGRDDSNDISISDLSISRKHTAVRREKAGVIVADLDSLNGTFVNKVPVKERLLNEGDQITVGHSVFLFTTASEQPDEPAVSFNDGKLPESTIQLAPGEGIYLQPADLHSDSDRGILRLRLLLELSGKFASARTEEQVAQTVLAISSETLATTDVAVLIVREDGSINSFYPQNSNRFSISRTVLNEVINKQIGILIDHVSTDASFSKVESLLHSGIQSILCVPISFRTAAGAIYVQSVTASHFRKDDLEWMTAVAQLTGMAFQNVRQWGEIREENQRLRTEDEIQHEMVGSSAPMQELYRFIGKVAPVQSTVLIQGESGTGKELVARAIHRNGPRRDKPFVAVNCAALAESLLESELFGYEKGAFTGAVSQKKGKIEVANGGTLFLDEIGEMPLSLQSKLLRVLQEREFDRVGGTHPVKVDIRVIAATNRDLQKALSDGSFREDLFYRLNVLKTNVRPLRERREDIPLLASYFISRFSGEIKRRVLGISSETKEILLHYDWPGNIRELQNTIERAVVLGTEDVILPEDLPDEILSTKPPSDSDSRYHHALNEAKKQLILKAFQQSGGNYTETAKMLGVHPNYLHRLIRNLNLKSALIRDSRQP